MAARHSARILKHLRQDSRRTLAAIARAEGLAISTVFDHVRQLEHSPIERHVSLLNYQKAGYPFRTFFYFQPDDQQAAVDFCTRHRGTNSIFGLSGGRIGLDAIFSSLQEEEEYKEALEGLGRDVSQHKVLEPLLVEQWTPKE